jgi:serine/threonine protein kinase
MPTININEIFANRYKLIKQLGIGGYSEVWLAEDQYAGNMEVAVKIYAPGKGLDEDGLKTFGKEYTTVFNLNNAHLLKPMHYDVYEGSPYLVLQYCKNGSLYKKIGKFKEADVAKFLHESCEAIAYLHKKEPPIIHQDIKPDNFLIDEDGNYLLADFGISSKIRRTLTRSIGEKASTGTMAYMPPEKFNEDRQAIKAGDIFSLGVCIFELLTGELAFGDLGGLALKSGADLPKLPDSYSKELNSIIRSCLAKDPWDRPTAITLMEIAKNYVLTGKWDLSYLSNKHQYVTEIPKEIKQQTEDVSDKEEDDWKKTSKSNTLNSYNAYIKKYPTGIFLKSALKAIEELKWQPAIINKTNIRLFEDYLKEYPNGIYAKDANTQIELLYKQRNKDAEEIWKKAEKEKSIAILKIYIDSYPDCEQIVEAKKELKKLEFIRLKVNIRIYLALITIIGYFIVLILINNYEVDNTSAYVSFSKNWDLIIGKIISLTILSLTIYWIINYIIINILEQDQK